VRRRRSLAPAAAAYAGARPPSPRTPWRAARWCVVDLELTGLDPRQDEIVSFAAVPIEDGRIRLDGAAAGLVRPSRPPGEASVRIHGLRSADLLDAPPLPEAIDPLLRAIAGGVLVAHAAHVERAFLGRALREQGVRLRGPIADTGVIGRLWLCERDGGAPSHLSLPELAQALGLPEHPQHEAFADALATAQVFIAAASHLDALGGETVRSLVQADRRLQAMLAYPSRGRAGG